LGEDTLRLRHIGLPSIGRLGFPDYRNWNEMARGQSKREHAMTMTERIRVRLQEAFMPSVLDVVNESDRHSGHRGSPGSGESHFRVHIVSQSFMGKSRVERHRMVNEALSAELGGGIHALAIKADAPNS
jgi:BolA family transcriptional regulator, general stress-responsive regulator